MTTFADASQARNEKGDDAFFLVMALVITLTAIAGFSTQLIAGRSTFAAPLVVHAHAIAAFGWIGIYLLQTIFATRGPIALHRRLGWIALGWFLLVIATGIAVTLFDVRNGRVPFFFRPQQFLIFDPMIIVGSAALIAGAIAMRRQTDWHRRLHYCALILLMGGPSIGRLLPMPLLIPWSYEVDFAVTFLFPLIGIAADFFRNGRVHPAWGVGIAAMLATFALIEGITFSPLGTMLYQAATAGSPGTKIAPLAFSLPPSG